jgi:hypothetical protein
MSSQATSRCRSAPSRRVNPVPNADNRCSASRPRQRSRAIRPPPRAVQLRPNVQWAEDALDEQQPLTVAPIVEEEHCRLCDGSRAVIGIGVPEIIGIAGEGSARTEFCIQVLLGRRPANGWEVEDIERT